MKNKENVYFHQKFSIHKQRIINSKKNGKWLEIISASRVDGKQFPYPTRSQESQLKGRIELDDSFTR